MEFFCCFLRNFLCLVEYERNLGLKFFLPFSAYLFLFWLKIMAKSGFLIFWIFLLFSSEFSWSGRLWTEFRTKICFFSFSAYLIPFSLKIMPESVFLIFWIFLLFFSELSCPGRVWTECGTKIFFSLSRPILSRFG